MSNTIEGFSVSHAAILDGTSGAELADIYGVREGSLDLDTDSYDNTGDDQVLSSLSWVNFATLSIQSGYIPFDLLSTLTGSPVASSGSGANAMYSIPLWDEDSVNQPVKPVLIRVPSRTAGAGALRTLDIVLYRVQFGPISFDGPSYKSGLLVSYTGKAFLSSTDEAGNALTKKAVGRLVDRARVSN